MGTDHEDYENAKSGAEKRRSRLSNTVGALVVGIVLALGGLGIELWRDSIRLSTHFVNTHDTITAQEARLLRLEETVRAQAVRMGGIFSLRDRDRVERAIEKCRATMAEVVAAQALCRTEHTELKTYIEFYHRQGRP